MDIFGFILTAFYVLTSISIMYFMTNACCGFKFSVALKKIKVFPVVGVFVLLFLIRTSFPFLTSTWIADIFFATTLLIISWSFFEKEKVVLNFVERAFILLFIYSIAYIITLHLKIILNYFIENEVAVGFTLHTSIILAVLLFCQKIDFNKLLISFFRIPFPKICIFIVAAISFSIFVSTNNIRNVSKLKTLLPTATLALLIPLVHYIKKIYRMTTIIPNDYHDAKKLLLLLDIKSEEATNVEELKSLLSESVDLMNLKLPPVPFNSKHKNFEAFIKHTIEAIKIEKKSKVKIHSDIQFLDAYNTLNDIKTSYILGLLLNHALATLIRYPIFVNITSSKSEATIQISYEYRFEKEQQRLEHALLNGKSLCRKDGCHLLKLKNFIELCNAKVSITRNEKYLDNIDYLSICLTFKGEGDPT